MNNSEAIELVARLRAAYPWVEVGERTTAIYVEFIERLKDAPTALNTIDVIIERERYFPAIAQIRDLYMSKLRTREPERALAEADLTDEERRANIARVEDMRAIVERSVSS